MSDKRTCDIFISYRRDGGDMTAMYIYQELKERKYDVFYDLEVLRAGKFNDSLLEYIDSCKDFVLVLSPGALDRCNDENDWVRKEIAEALRLKKNIIPIMMKGFKFPDVLPDEIDDVRYQNGLTATTEYFKESMDRLCGKYLLTKGKKSVSLPAIVAVGAVVILAAFFAGRSFLLPGGVKPDGKYAATEMMTEKATEAITEKVTEKMTEAVTEKPTEKMTEAVTEKPTEKMTEAATEKATEKVTEKPAEKAAEAVKTEPICDTDWPVMRSDSPWDDNKYTYDSAENEFCGIGEVCNMPVFGNESVLRKDVGSITILNSLENAGEDAWDISEAQDGSVLAWTEKNGALYDLFIAGDGGVRAPENCPGLFCMYRNVQAINLNGNLDTSENDSFDSFFEGCTSLKSLDIRTLDTSGVTNFRNFMRGCEKLTSLDVSTMDTSRATMTDGMFWGMSSLKSLDLSDFRTSRVTDMNAMFGENYKLKKLILGDGFDTSRVKNMEGMFQNCANLMELDVSGFQTAAVEKMRGMFEGCRELMELDVSGFDTSKVKDMQEMFRYCEMLDGLDLSGWKTDAVEATENMFIGCEALTGIGTEEGALYDRYCEDLRHAEAMKYWSRDDFFIDSESQDVVSVLWDRNKNIRVNCAFAYDKASGHSYVFANFPATGSGANDSYGADGHLVAIGSKEELEFLEQWSQREGLNFNEIWVMGCGDFSMYNDDKPKNFDWKDYWKNISTELPGGVVEKIYLDWANDQPDGSGHWLQLVQTNESGWQVLHMDDVGDELRRPFIVEVDRKLEAGDEIDLSYHFTDGNDGTGYGEEIRYTQNTMARLDESGVLRVSGFDWTEMLHWTWYSPYIREVQLKGLKRVGDHSFDQCRNLSKVTLSDKLQEIGGMAFAGTALTEITIPSSVKKIEDNAFAWIEENLTIYGEEGSYAQSYAKKMGIRFEEIPAEQMDE